MEKIETIVNSISHFNFSPKSLSSLLKKINELKLVAIDYTEAKRDDFLKGIEGLRIEFSRAVIAEIDKVEANLGFKPGILAFPLSQYFDNFYHDLLDKIVDRSAQHDLGLLIDTSPISARVEAEKVRFSTLEKELTINTNRELSILSRLDALDKKLENDIHVFTQPEAQKEFLDCYRQIVPHLTHLESFSEKMQKLQVNFLQARGNELDYRATFETLMTSIQFKVSDVMSTLEKIENFEKSISDERLQYFEKLLTQEKTNAQNKIEEFKRNKIDAMVCKILSPLGPYANSFSQLINPILLKNNEAFLNNLSMHDDIEAKLKSRLVPQIHRLIKQLDVRYKNNTPSEQSSFTDIALTEKELQDLKRTYSKYINANSNHIMLRDMKMQLSHHLRDKNPLAQQKFEFITKEDARLIEFTRNHTAE